MGNNSEKSELIPHAIALVMQGDESFRALEEGLLAYQVVGRVTAYQA